MKEYVLILSVGPVQGFIAAARRSRDLWSGSWLLSEMAKAGARYLYEQKANLVFPTVGNPEKDLAPASDFSIGNKIQVVITAENSESVRAIAEGAKAAIQARFEAEAEFARAAIGHFKIRENIWQHQVQDYLEVQAAWAMINESEKAGYKEACDQASGLLAARKATRDFNASALSAYDTEFMLPKSSLDGARETVLPERFLKQGTMARKLGLTDGEQLDTSGIVKRLCGDVDQFTPYTRVAAEKWVQDLNEDEVKALNDAYEPLIALELATRVRGNQGCYAKFPFDAQYLYQFRLEAVLSRLKAKGREAANNAGDAIAADEAEDSLAAYNALLNLQETLRPLWRKFGDPCRYGVLLLADGDKMGELLDHADTLEAHQVITQALSEFAGSVAETMRHFTGHTIYAGGDDVLGFVPLATAYDCAKALAEKFTEYLAPVAKSLGAVSPTLSVGLAIAHVNTPLGHIRGLAQRAEKIAKGDHVKESDQQRNALGITLAVRSGSTTDIRIRWDDEKALATFHEWMDDYTNNELTSRLAYDTREVHLRTNFLAKDTQADLLEKIRLAEFTRMLKHARTTAGAKIAKEMITKLENRFEALGSLEQLATELIIARWMSAKTQRDLGKE